MRSSTAQKDLLAQRQQARMTAYLSQHAVLTALACVFVACQQEAPWLTPPVVSLLPHRCVTYRWPATDDDGHRSSATMAATMAAITHSSCHTT